MSRLLIVDVEIVKLYSRFAKIAETTTELGASRTSQNVMT